MRWIRVEAATPDHPVMHEMAETLGVKLAAAVGHYTAVCCRMGEHREDGMLANVTDATLEAWALWEGKRGRFAAAFRARCQDEDGRLHGWWRQDRLRERAERDRERKRVSGGIPAETPPEFLRNEEVDSSGIPRSPARGRAGAHAPSRVVVGGEDDSSPEGVRGNLPPEVEDALVPYTRPHRFPESVRASVRGLLNPEANPHYPVATVVTALRQMQEKGRDFAGPTLARWCANIERDAKQAPPSTGGATMAKMRRA